MVTVRAPAKPLALGKHTSAPTSGNTPTRMVAPLGGGEE